MIKSYDYIIVGGGLIGFSIGYGLSKLGRKCLILDTHDNSIKAARGNFGLIWVQGKGTGFPSYADWTMRSSELWENFGNELEDDGKINLGIQRTGGIHICLDEEEYEDRKNKLDLLRSHQNGKFDYQMLDNKDLSQLMPGIGSEVTGGSFSKHDGHVNPLYLIKSLHSAFLKNHGKFLHDEEVKDIEGSGKGFSIKTKKERYFSSKVILSAGLGNKNLAPMVGLEQPVKPIKGQILITQKLDKHLKYPSTLLRQTQEGSIMIGDSHEDIGENIATNPMVISKIAKRAIKTFPEIENKQIVRSWAALRVMSPDGYPIYDQSETHPGAFAISCHSGVTLAASHANDLSRYIDDGKLGNELISFSHRRFNVS